MKNRYIFGILIGTLLGLYSSASAQAPLDINEVSTWVRPNNSLFWNLQQFASYEVPKGSGKNALFVGNLWFLGKKPGTQDLYGFADRYQSNGPDVTTGPLRIDGSAGTNLQTVLEFGRIWKLNRSDIDALQLAQANGTLTSGAYVPPQDVLDWPGNGPTGYATQLSPYHDANANGIYNIYEGDYPLMKGEQMLYWILNDTYGQHNESGALPMGAEVHVSFYACANADPVGEQSIVNYSTFLEYEIFNRSQNNYEEIYAGFNTDADVGYAFDDYVGSHVDADAFYFYTGDAIDAQGGNAAPDQYGLNSPVQSIQFLEGQAFEDRSMAYFRYYTNSSGSSGDPEIGMPHQYYNLLQGDYIYYGGSGFDSTVSNLHARYMFPGPSDPLHQGTGGVDPGFEWSQQFPCPACPETSTGDQRGVGSSGPFTLAPGGSIKVVLGLLTTFDSTLTVPQRVQKNREQNKQLKTWYQNNQLPCVHSPLAITEAPADAFSVYPNPAKEYTLISGKNISPGTAYRLLDLNGREIRSGVSSQSGTLYLPTDALPAGLYFVQVQSPGSKPAVVKIIKQ